jgi:hypothetical protein
MTLLRDWKHYNTLVPYMSGLNVVLLAFRRMAI